MGSELVVYGDHGVREAREFVVLKARVQSPLIAPYVLNMIMVIFTVTQLKERLAVNY